MRSLPTAGIYHDTRYQNKDALYPIKIRITYLRKSRFYKTGISISKDLFEKSYMAKQPQGKNLRMKEELLDLVAEAKKKCKDLDFFSFQKFEDVHYGSGHSDRDVLAVYDQVIGELTEEGKLSTAELYGLSKATIAKFFCKNGQSQLSFESVTPKSLKQLQNWMIEEDKSVTTISIYLRNLRHVFNVAIYAGIIPEDLYPFKRHRSERDRYQIPKERNTKKALSFDQIKKLKEHPVIEGSPQQKARDFWMLSFYLQGLNIVDILNLHNKYYQDYNITVYRQKTADSLSEKKKLVVTVPEAAVDIINCYRSTSKDLEARLFPFLKIDLDSADKRRTVKNFTRMINQNIKTLAKEAGLPLSVSTLWARHSYATLAKNKGVSTEFISEALGHSNITTTRYYLDSFKGKIRQETTDKIFEGL